MKNEERIIDGVVLPGDVTNTLARRILNRIGRYESMSGAGRCPVYLERWTLFYRLGYGCYLHRFIGDDWAADPHDHPRRFLSIGLRGWYWEDIFSHDGSIIETRQYTAPWIRTFPAEHLHRVRAAECGDCWTLVFVFRKSRAWGFVRNGVWIPFRKYVFGRLARTAC